MLNAANFSVRDTDEGEPLLFNPFDIGKGRVYRCFLIRYGSRVGLKC